MRYRVLPYKTGSKSAKALAEALGGKVLKLVGSKFVPKTDDIIVNWGNTTFNESAEWGPKTPDAFFNYDTDIMRHVTNKLMFFNMMKESCNEIIPKFWTSKDSIPPDAYPVVCRTILSGHSGAGIVIANSPDDLVDASLYVQYIKKKDEYRVHIGRKSYKQVSLDVFGDPDEADNHNGYEHVVIAVQRKARSSSATNVNWQVRSHGNGFVFVRNNVNPPPCVISSAIKSFEASSLDFGAIDVIYNDQQEKAYVLEINTAPGLEGQTIQDYATFFKPTHT